VKLDSESSFINLLIFPLAPLNLSPALRPKLFVTRLLLKREIEAKFLISTSRALF